MDEAAAMLGLHAQRARLARLVDEAGRVAALLARGVAVEDWRGPARLASDAATAPLVRAARELEQALLDAQSATARAVTTFGQAGPAGAARTLPVDHGR